MSVLGPNLTEQERQEFLLQAMKVTKVSQVRWQYRIVPSLHAKRSFLKYVMRESQFSHLVLLLIGTR